jgi:sugar phosphate isomerase/epimerase
MEFDPKKFGIVQGRLSKAPSGELQYFPHGNWANEFGVGRELGYGFIELLIERDDKPSNPFWLNSGAELKEKASGANSEIYTVCSDYVIEHSLFNDLNSSVVEHTLSVVERSAEIGATALILPLLEKSDCSLYSFSRMAEVLGPVSDAAEEHGITVLLETLLKADDLLLLLAETNRTNVKVVFDTGNRINMTSNLSHEILKLGEHIGHVHIKDKNAANENVILGTGKVNFLEAAEALRMIGFDQSFAFETTRGKVPERTAKFHLDFWQYFWIESTA